MDIETIKKIVGDNKLHISTCTICGYGCGYVFRAPAGLYYDAGCDCVTYHDFRPSTSQDLLDIVEMNNWTEEDIRQKLI